MKFKERDPLQGTINFSEDNKNVPEEKINCQYCEDVGFCNYCERGKIATMERTKANEGKAIKDNKFYAKKDGSLTLNKRPAICIWTYIC